MPPKCRKKKKKHQQQKDIANPGHHYGIPTRETLSQRPRVDDEMQNLFRSRFATSIPIPMMNSNSDDNQKSFLESPASSINSAFDYKFEKDFDSESDSTEVDGDGHSLPPLMDPPDSDSSSSDEDYGYVENMRDLSYHDGDNDISAGGKDYFAILREARRMAKHDLLDDVQEFGSDEQRIDSIEGSKSVEDKDLPSPLNDENSDDESNDYNSNVEPTFHSQEYDFYENFSCSERITDFSQVDLTFDCFASFVKFPPLGKIYHNIKIFRNFIGGNHTLGKMKRDWCIRKLDHIEGFENIHVNESLWCLKKSVDNSKSEREEKLKNRLIIAPENVSLSSLRVLFHIEKYNDLSVDRILARMHMEPAFYKKIQTKLELDKKWRKSRVEKKCNRCGKASNGEGRLKFCTSCFNVCYCNQKCQKADWKYHSASCDLKDNFTKITDYNDEPMENKIENPYSFVGQAYEFLMNEMEGKSQGGDLEGSSFCDVLVKLFETSPVEALWLSLPDTKSATLLKSIFKNSHKFLDYATQVWFKLVVEDILLLACKRMRRNDMTVLLSSDVPVRMPLVLSLLESTNQQNEFTNKFCRDLKVVTIQSKSESAIIRKASGGKLSKKARKNFLEAINRGESQMKEQTRHHTVVSVSGINPISTQMSEKSKDRITSTTKKKVQTIPQYRKDFYFEFDTLIKWYENYYEEIKMGKGGDKHAMKITHLLKGVQTIDTLRDSARKYEHATEVNEKRSSIVSKQEVSSEMTKCLELDNEDEQDKLVERVSSSVSIEDWGETGDEDVWTVEITESAHKWFKKNAKKSKAMVTRVLGRLKILSSGRWPYVLKKPLKTKSNNVRLYESKIDSGSRIIWQIAVTFSPRRSTVEQSFCEQVVRVWDIVEDHDNLTRAIDLAVQRIERSYQRGAECMIYSELDATVAQPSSLGSACEIPSVFRMKSGMKTKSGSDEKLDGFIYSPVASHDDQQYTLLKFYSLNAAAVKQLLRADDNDLPFTPGQKEYEIIQHKSSPPRPILLMGRSGTGKTTCLVFRMWSQYMAYATTDDAEQRPKQLFLTKNNVLKVEVKKAFVSMGSLFKKGTEQSTNCSREYFPRFLSSSEWLDLLDVILPGKRFFSTEELERRTNTRAPDDFITNIVASQSSSKGNLRVELTYRRFRKLWTKINSRIGCDYDPALVYIEIKSYIKGSIFALHLDELDMPQKKFLSRDQYLNLPRKMSRMGREQRNIVYDLFVRYEQLKKESNYYDEMDLVFNLTHRACKLNKMDFTPEMVRSQLLQVPFDSCFVDEVQDFTQAELFLLAKLSRDPNNLMLAGDTAQSIAVGVGFRFVDVRQIFYEHFNCVEPDLLQLVHNYRSHGGILRLAACVVELLHFFFNDSLDTLPPDQGLFNGPKPVVIEATDPTELVILMNGGEHETSRIEFGAHQVILVRNEEAKSRIPEKFVSDKDWILTVHEAKGLEFDDVLIYNFFTDSDAQDIWRVITNYTEHDMKEFYNKFYSDTMGKRSYTWSELDETKITRTLDFQSESHKVLESELKILYTAITRARVNVYIAEDNIKSCRPMFNYFMRRDVVDLVDKSSKDSLSTINAFGKSVDTPEEWIRRGLMFLTHAESTQQRSHLLRLASKCFHKGGDTNREMNALADLAFAELEEDQSNVCSENRLKSSYIQDHKKIYDVALKLIATRDENLLAKAGRCIIQVGEFERMRTAHMMELSAKLMYAKRQLSSIDSETNLDTIAPNEIEQQNFCIAAQLLTKYISDMDEDLSNDSRRDILLRIIYNLLASSKETDLNQVVDVVLNNTPDIYYLSSSLGKMLKYRGDVSAYHFADPMRYFYSMIDHSSDNPLYDRLRNAIISTIEKACIFFVKSGEKDEFQLALDALSSDKDKHNIKRRLGILS